MPWQVSATSCLSAPAAAQSIVYPIDDVMLPRAVTVPLADALLPFTSGNGRFNTAVRGSAGALQARCPVALTQYTLGQGFHCSCTLQHKQRI